ncbi:hypothetical protein ID866_4238 [Astraeus odoratus]|nr:hypothetical protein ID866_4238 [Astraeus odoratus]
MMEEAPYSHHGGGFRTLLANDVSADLLTDRLTYAWNPLTAGSHNVSD